MVSMAIADNEGSSEEPNFSDAEDFTDDVPDEELVGDILKQKPSEDDSAECVIIVDGIPKVSRERLPKLSGVLSKVFGKFGPVISEKYPEDENGDTKGYMFVEYAVKSQAEEAVAVLNGYKLDKQHMFTVNLFTDLEKYKHVDAKWEKAKPRPYKDHGNLRSWLLNPDCQDHYVIQWEGGEKIAVVSNSLNEPKTISEKARWSDTTVQWSPYGTYLASVHYQGIALWGGESMEQIMKFSHPGVQYFDFSPTERYMVTFSPPKSRYMDSPDALIVWDLRTGDLKRSFPGGQHNVKKWPHFKWSIDDKYFAFMKDDAIFVYETPSFGLLDKKSIKIENVRDFQWSPSEPYFAYWAAEKEQVPGRVAVMKIPERVDVRSKNLFSLADASIFWQKSGDNLGFKTERYGKKKEEKDEVKYSHITYGLELFHMREKGYPLSTQELKEPIQAFAFEPMGTKLAVIHGDLRQSVTFYSVKSNPATVAHLKTIEQKNQVNTIFWSPMGNYIVLAGMKTTSTGALVFIDAGGSEVTVLNNQEHPAVTEVEWDPTGRYVVSHVSTWHATRGVDYGFMMWNFQGRLLQRKPMDRFCKFTWRPRPPPIMTEAKIKEVKKNMKKYAEVFEKKDREIETQTSEEVKQKRRQQMDEFNKWRNQRRAEWKDERVERIELRGEETDDLDVHDANGPIEEETIEYMVSQEETIEP